MRRVVVMGPGGAGKSTLTRSLGDRTGIELVHLDRLFWRPGWDPMPRDEWRALIAEVVRGEAWIMDGNYSGTLDLRLPAADTVVLLDLPRRVTIPGVVRRVWRHHGEAVQAPGCPERWDREFLRWVWNYRRDSRPRVLAAIAAHAGSADVVMLRSRGDVRRWLASVPQASPR